MRISAPYSPSSAAIPLLCLRILHSHVSPPIVWSSSASRLPLSTPLRSSSSTDSRSRRDLIALLTPRSERLAASRGDVPVDVEIGRGGVAHLEPLGSGCRIRKGEQRHDEDYHSDTDSACSKP